MECLKGELDLMTGPIVQNKVLHGYLKDYYPANTSYTDSDAPIEFEISGNETEYLDLSECYLYTKAQIVDHSGVNITDKDQIGPTNLFLHSLFNQIEVKLNNSVVVSPVTGYPYRAYIESVLNFGECSKKSYLQSEMFYKDTAQLMDSIEIKPPTQTTDPDKRNKGWMSRRLFMEKPIEMYGRLHLDLVNQGKYLLNNTSITVKLNRSKNSFALIGSDSCKDFKVLLQKATLYIRRVEVAPDIMLHHAKALSSRKNAIYPLRRVEVKTFSIAQGVRSKTNEKISNGVLPVRVVVGLVESDAYNGVIKKNPFNFQHFNLASIQLLTGKNNFPHTPILCNYGGNEYVRAYHTLFTELDKGLTKDGNDISLREYPNGYCLYAFNLTPDSCNGEHQNLKKQDDLILAMYFDTPLVNHTTAIVYLEYENVLELNELRKTITDFTL